MIARSRVWRPAIRRSPIVLPGPRRSAGRTYLTAAGALSSSWICFASPVVVGGGWALRRLDGLAGDQRSDRPRRRPSQHGAELLGRDRRRQEARAQRGQLPRRQEAVALRRRRRHGRPRRGRGRVADRGARVPRRGRGGQARSSSATRKGDAAVAPAGDPGAARARGAERPAQPSTRRGRPSPRSAAWARPPRRCSSPATAASSRTSATAASTCCAPGQVQQLTEDHSLVNELVRRGKLTKEEIDDSPYKAYKNAVTRAVGVYETVEVDTIDFEILPGDQFLLCSDGLHAYLDDAAASSTCSAGDDITDAPEEAGRARQRRRRPRQHHRARGARRGRRRRRGAATTAPRS